MKKVRNFLKAHFSQRYFPIRSSLILLFLLIFTPILVGISSFNLIFTQVEIRSSYAFLEKQSESNIIDTLNLVDEGYKMLESTFHDEIRNDMDLFLNEYSKFNDTKFLNLYEIQSNLSLNYELYIINASGIIVNTTYLPDMGLDFKNFPEFFQHLTEIRLGFNITYDRLILETQTGYFRQYSYAPTKDHKYIFELGLYFEAFDDINQEFDYNDIIEDLMSYNPYLINLRILDLNGFLYNGNGTRVDNSTLEIIKDLNSENNSLAQFNSATNHKYKYIYINLKDENYPSDPSKIVELIYDYNELENKLTLNTILHITLGILITFFSTFLIFLIANYITKPIKKIVDDVNKVAEGDLDHEIHVNVKNELKVLSSSVNLMIQNMKSYIAQVKESKQNEIIKLKELDKIRKNLITRISHELKTPMMSIKGASELILDFSKDELSEETVKFFNIIKSGEQRLEKLVENLIDVSRLQYGKFDLILKKENMIEIIKESVEEMQPYINKRNIDLQLDLANEIFVKIDKFRIRQVISNLLSNSIKNTPPHKNIWIKCHHDEMWVEFSIRDTGIGFTKDEINRLFTQFGKFERNEPGLESIDIQGSGLGLYISKEIIKAHNGMISAQSEGRFKGSLFIFKIPFK